MRLSSITDAPSEKTDKRPAVLRVDRFDALMASRGARTVREQAEHCGMRRTHLADIKAGRVGVSLPTALRMARHSGGTVEFLFENAA